MRRRGPVRRAAEVFCIGFCLGAFVEGKDFGGLLRFFSDFLLEVG